MRGATFRTRSFLCIRRYFNPHSPCGERPPMADIFCPFLMISIHTPHAGSDYKCCDAFSCQCLFQSTLPMRGATAMILPVLFLWQFQSTLPMRGATCICFNQDFAFFYFNPHSPCGERRVLGSIVGGFFLFQSTLPMRGATS